MTEQHETLIAVVEQVKYIAKTVDRTEKSVDALRKEIQDNYVRNERFEPVKLLTFGTAGLILTAVIGAIVSNVL